MKFIIKQQIIQGLATFIGVILLVFFLFNWVGGDPALVLAGKLASAQDIQNIRHQLGTDLPIWEQLLLFFKQVVTGDFGLSWSTREPVSHIFLTRLGPSLTLLIPMMILETVIAVSLALWSSAQNKEKTDYLLILLSTLMMSVSLLVYIIVGQWLFAAYLGWFPVKGWGDDLWVNLRYFAPLPVFLGLLVSISPSLRLYRSFIRDVVQQDYVRTVRSHGFSERFILTKVVLGNAIIPIITNVLMGLPSLLVGAFLIERFFAIPGIGRELIMAVERSDFPVIKAMTVYVALATLLANFMAECLYYYLDPRISKYSDQKEESNG